MRTMYINHRPVGSGMWSLESVKRWCAKQGVELGCAYSIYATADGAATDTLDVEKGTYKMGNITNHLN